jgi:hypothetical protein
VALPIGLNILKAAESSNYAYCARAEIERWEIWLQAGLPWHSVLYAGADAKIA